MNADSLFTTKALSHTSTLDVHYSIFKSFLLPVILVLRFPVFCLLPFPISSTLHSFTTKDNTLLQTLLVSLVRYR